MWIILWHIHYSICINPFYLILIPQERDTKMTYQNVSIVLSPTMQISHRVLNVLFLNHAYLFGNVIIKRSVSTQRYKIWCVFYQHLLTFTLTNKIILDCLLFDVITVISYLLRHAGSWNYSFHENNGMEYHWKCSEHYCVYICINTHGLSWISVSSLIFSLICHLQMKITLDFGNCLPPELNPTSPLFMLTPNL